jgi:hypothetical protein
MLFGPVNVCNYLVLSCNLFSSRRLSYFPELPYPRQDGNSELRKDRPPPRSVTSIASVEATSPQIDEKLSWLRCSCPFGAFIGQRRGPVKTKTSLPSAMDDCQCGGHGCCQGPRHCWDIMRGQYCGLLAAKSVTLEAGLVKGGRSE